MNDIEIFDKQNKNRVWLKKVGAEPAGSIAEYGQWKIDNSNGVYEVWDGQNQLTIDDNTSIFNCENLILRKKKEDEQYMDYPIPKDLLIQNNYIEWQEEYYASFFKAKGIASLFYGVVDVIQENPELFKLSITVEQLIEQVRKSNSEVFTTPLNKSNCFQIYSTLYSVFSEILNYNLVVLHSSQIRQADMPTVIFYPQEKRNHAQKWSFNHYPTKNKNRPVLYLFEYWNELNFGDYQISSLSCRLIAPHNLELLKATNAFNNSYKLILAPPAEKCSSPQDLLWIFKSQGKIYGHLRPVGHSIEGFLCEIINTELLHLINNYDSVKYKGWDMLWNHDIFNQFIEHCVPKEFTWKRTKFKDGEDGGSVGFDKNFEGKHYCVEQFSFDLHTVYLWRNYGEPNAYTYFVRGLDGEFQMGRIEDKELVERLNVVDSNTGDRTQYNQNDGIVVSALKEDVLSLLRERKQTRNFPPIEINSGVEELDNDEVSTRETTTPKEPDAVLHTQNAFAILEQPTKRQELAEKIEGVLQESLKMPKDKKIYIQPVDKENKLIDESQSAATEDKLSINDVDHYIVTMNPLTLPPEDTSVNDNSAIIEVINEPKPHLMDIYNNKIVVPENWKEALPDTQSDSVVISLSNSNEEKEALQLITMAKLALDTYITTQAKTAEGLFGKKTIRMSGTNELFKEVVTALVLGNDQLKSSQKTSLETDPCRIAINALLKKEETKVADVDAGTNAEKQPYKNYLDLSLFGKKSAKSSLSSNSVLKVT